MTVSLPSGLNFILLALVIVASSVTILQTTRDRVTNSSRWIPVSVALICCSLLLYVFLPTYAGYISAGLWLLFAIVPSLGFHLSNHLHYRGQYARARQVKRWMQWLHPLPDWPWQDAVFQANIHMHAGRRDEATALLQQTLATTDTTPEREVLVFAMSHDWHGLVAWWETYPEQTQLTQRPDVIRHYLRALGETNQLATLIERFTYHQPILKNVPLLYHYAYLYLFAFGGKVEQATQILREQLADILDPSTQIFWIATAHSADNNDEMCSALLRPILRTTTNGITRFNIEERLAHDLAKRDHVLAPDDLRQLNAIADQWSRRNQMLSPWY